MWYPRVLVPLSPGFLSLNISCAQLLIILTDTPHSNLNCFYFTYHHHFCVCVCVHADALVSQRIYGGQRNFGNQSFLPPLDLGFALKVFIQEPLSHLTSPFHSNLIRKLLSFYLFLKDCIYYFVCLRFLSACHFFMYATCVPGAQRPGEGFGSL